LLSTSTSTSTGASTLVSAATAVPFVSVIVPTWNRAEFVEQLLNALSFQVYPSDRLEVLVIDNSSTDNTEEVVAAASARFAFPVRYHRKANDGPAASRNRGAELATGEILAFTDSDCLPVPGWIASAVSHFQPGVGVVCGPVRPAPITHEHPFFIHQVRSIDREEGLYPTANAFYRRDVFFEFGGFDETSRTYSWGQPVGGDDTEFAWRVKRAGYASAFAKGAAILHQATPVRPKEYLLSAVQAQVIPRLAASYPELRETCLYRHYFVHKDTATFDLLLFGLLLSRATRWSLLLGIPWLTTLYPLTKQDLWPPRYWGRAAARVVLRVESAILLELALLRSSVRNRTLVI
jgi:glycosyltransferase involved in cell wall biosynthesis